MNRYGAPTTYKRITPGRGCGFILKRIYELTEAPGRERFAWPRKIDVYLGTPWYKRPGYASLLWSSLIKDGLIESNGGMQEYTYCSFYKNPRTGMRASGRYAYGIGYTVRYHLTPKGRGILFDMMARVNAKNKTQPKLNTVGSVAEFDAKKDECSLPCGVLENMARTDLIREYSIAAMEADRLYEQLLTHEHDVNDFHCDRINAAYNNICVRRAALAKEIEQREKNGEDGVPLLAMLANVSENQKLRDAKKDAIPAPPNPVERDILEKEALDCAKLAADYAGENQKLRAEKNDLNERIKKLVLRLEWLEHEVSDVKSVLNEIIG